ncbi:hypothetical protein C8Q72DRAFT_888547 [Fomitopsis betulina]|nr:hypothetical protein C8Q72DRAFT_888546 [Fomitopsis betulina]KAI0725562.1 hypothetical protein C8Q72DRAFT_888547 [Fomitopsis betulina]
MSSEEDNYLLDAPSPRPLFDDGSDQGSDHTYTTTSISINPTQCISEHSITPTDFKGSADEDDDLELLRPPPPHPPPPYALLLCRPRLHLLSTQRTLRKRRSWTLEAEQRRTNSKVSQNSYNIMNT